MLLKTSEPRVRELDELVYEKVVPQDHYLRKVLKVIPWDDFYDLLAPYYSLDVGRPAEDPVLMLKLEYLRYHHSLSDREVIARSVTDLAFRNFLQIPLRGYLPDPSSLCIFRGRLGRKGFRDIFASVVQTAREYGVVKDRLRIKDATHVIGNIAVPSALALVAQIRDKLLSAAEPFAPQMVEGERVNLEMLREASKGLNPKEKLVTRVAQLRENLVWADTLTPPKQAETNRAWQLFLAQRDLAHKILEDREHPTAGDRTISVTDPEARTGKHGDWYDGYLVDVLFDPDSELVTSINVLPASGDEAVDALELIYGEEAAHGNQIEALSMDGVGFNGPLLRELEDPENLNIDTYVPPPAESKAGLFTPRDFQEDREQGVVTCPAGQTSTQYQYEPEERSRVYRFSASTCRTCPLVAQCMKQAPRRRGRTVRKTEYQAEHDRVRQKATTPAYARVRREHLKVERKLSELVNRHGGRRAHYWGNPKVFIQEAMACTAMNIKRLVRLTCAPTPEVCGQE
jgi:transposase